MTITAPPPPPVAPPRPTPNPAGAASAAVRERRWWLPRRVRLVDAGFTATAGALALTGLAPSFDGYQFLVVGLLGLLLGTAAGMFVVHLRWPRALSLVAAVAVFYLLGGVLCLREVPAIWPVPHTWRLLTDQLVFGWKDLLTTLPPVDGRGPLLTLPWALGLLAGSGAMAATSWSSGPRWLRAIAPATVLLALWAVVILLGLDHPQSVLVQGVVFSVVLLAWIAVRGQRTAVDLAGSTGRIGRGAVAGALLVLAGTAAAPVALGGADPSEQRVILRDVIDRPFDVGRYPSPLASFRRYVEVPHNPPAENLYTTDLFSILGVPEGTLVRFATLDSYDGKVWGASNNAIPGASDDTYQRVSSTIANPVSGDHVEVTVKLGEGYSGVWLPTVGALQGIRFRSADLTAEADSFRYNLATSAGVVPAGLRPGDEYSFTAVIPDGDVDADSVPGGPVGAAGTAAAFLQAQASEWSKDEKTLMKRVFAVADHLREEGRYTDGVAPAEQIYHAGHSQGRLAEFVNSPIIAGNDEQYAATMALLANQIGVPARVVMGAVVPRNGVVRGSDVAAWVEIQVSDGSWRTLPTSAFMGTQRPAKLPPESQQNVGGTNVPPPAPIPPPTTAGDQADVDVKADKAKTDDPKPSPEKGPLLPGWARALLIYGGIPLAVLGLLAAGIIVAKAVRRRLRRRSPRTSTQVAGAWRELVDHARDLGQPVPAGGVVTRREQSVQMASATAPTLARRADGYVFGPEPPPMSAADSFWGDVTAERRAMSSSASRSRRLLAAVSLRTFRRS